MKNQQINSESTSMVGNGRKMNLVHKKTFSPLIKENGVFF